MLKRLFSTISINKINCSDCRLYNKTTKICKLNSLNASDNRFNNDVCGIKGDKFWPLDKTNLIISETYFKQSAGVMVFTLSSLPFGLLYDGKFAVLSYISLLIGSSLSVLARDHENKYFDDNDISGIK